MTQSVRITPRTTTDLPQVSRVASALALLVATWEQRSRTRRGLVRLDAHLLRDLGLDEATAGAESAKPFWRA